MKTKDNRGLELLPSIPVAFGQKVLGTNRSDMVLCVGKALNCRSFGRLGFLPVPNLLVHFTLSGCPTPIVGEKRCNELKEPLKYFGVSA